MFHHPVFRGGGRFGGRGGRGVGGGRGRGGYNNGNFFGGRGGNAPAAAAVEPVDEARDSLREQVSHPSIPRLARYHLSVVLSLCGLLRTISGGTLSNLYSNKMD